MGCSASKNVDQDSSPGPVSKTSEPGKVVDFKEIHSAIRWNKNFEEIKSLASSKEAVNVVDPGNGNCPIHIAAQNGHLNIVNFLIQKKANLDAKNLKGNTALHMAISYDYYDCAKALVAAGANIDILNDAGHPACKGLEGESCFAMAAFVSANNIEEIDSALSLCEAEYTTLEKSKFIQTGLKSKKKFGASWTPSHQEKFKSIAAKI